MEQTITEQTRLPGKQRRSQALIERDVRAYERHMAGLSVRAIGDELSIKSTQTVWGSIQRGKSYVEEHGIDVEERKIEIDQLFKRTLGALAEEIQIQRKEGRVTLITRNDGSEEIRRIKGIDPRTAEALARSADRWAQFLGITDRGQEVNQASTTLIQLAAPADGASFGSKWAEGAVDMASAADAGPSITGNTPSVGTEVGTSEGGIAQIPLSR